ncbi:MAG: hypothetical protein FWE39_19640, partial [Nocardiaceae bacterium]|nr:hypothetical protein [Nocardiaceae bacterium]
MTTPDPNVPTVLDLLQASPVGPVLDMPVPRTPMEALAASPLGPLLDTPFTDIAAGALPPLPALPALPPLPTLPPLPGIDQLLQPVTELASAFGTGTLGGFDPTSLLRQSSSIIDTALSMGISGLKALDGAWDGQAAVAAQTQGLQTQAAGEQLSQRGNEIASVTQEAAGTVARGNAELAAVAESFVATAVAAAPVALTPPGQTMLIAAAADHLQRALSVVAKTRAELAGHQTALAALGTPILVPPAPIPAPGLTTGGGPSPISVAASLLEAVGKPLVQSATHDLPDQTYAAGVTAPDRTDFAPRTMSAGIGGHGAGSAGSAVSAAYGGGVGGGFGGGLAASGSIARGSSAAQLSAGALTSSPSVQSATAAAGSAAANTVSAGMGSPGMMSPAGARHGYDDTVDRSAPGYLVGAAPSNNV